MNPLSSVAYFAVMSTASDFVAIQPQQQMRKPLRHAPKPGDVVYDNAIGLLVRVARWPCSCGRCAGGGDPACAAFYVVASPHGTRRLLARASMFTPWPAERTSAANPSALSPPSLAPGARWRDVAGLHDLFVNESTVRVRCSPECFGVFRGMRTLHGVALATFDDHVGLGTQDALDYAALSSLEALDVVRAVRRITVK